MLVSSLVSSVRLYFTLFVMPVLSVSWPYDPIWCVTVLEKLSMGKYE